MAAKQEVQFVIRARDLTRGVFRRIRRGLRGIGDAVFRLRTLFLAAFGAAVGGSILSTTSALNQLKDAAEGLRVSPAFLQTFRRTAEEVGLSAEQADTVLQRLQTRIGEATTGTNPRMLEHFQRLGLAIGELRSLSTEEILDRIISRVREMDAASRQAALAPVVDTEGVRMITRVAEQFASIAEAQRDMQRRGLLISDDVLGRAERLHDLFRDMRDVIRVAFLRTMIPALERGVELVTEMINKWESAWDESTLKRVQDLARAAPRLDLSRSSIGNPVQDIIRRRELSPRQQFDVINREALEYSRRIAEATEKVARNGVPAVLEP